jgi:hypothetical protein
MLSRLEGRQDTLHGRISLRFYKALFGPILFWDECRGLQQISSGVWSRRVNTQKKTSPLLNFVIKTHDAWGIRAPRNLSSVAIGFFYVSRSRTPLSDGDHASHFLI